MGRGRVLGMGGWHVGYGGEMDDYRVVGKKKREGRQRRREE